MSELHVVIGIDGGGSCTRAMVCDLSGNVLSYAEAGAASIHKDLYARDNVQIAITSALKAANAAYSQVRGISAGIAGHESELDLEWILPLTDVVGLDCPKWHYNDAVAALYEATLGNPGIIAISGTGSVVAAITEDGHFIRNVEFQHYASSAARYLSFAAVHELLAGNADDSDEKLIREMLIHWKVSSIKELYLLGLSKFTEDRRERDQHFGYFAPFVTEAAAEGSALARRVCKDAVSQLRIGIEMMGQSFSSEVVSIAYVGSVINSPYMKSELTQQLQLQGHKQYVLIKNHLSPVAGSVIYALKQLGVVMDDSIVNRLRQFDSTAMD